MDNFELCEKLVNKTGVSFAQAKDALERSNWDMLDAMVLLENEKLIHSAGERYSSQSSPETGAAEEPAAFAQAGAYEQPRREQRQEKEARRSKAKEDARNFFGKAGRFLTENRIIAYNNIGREVLNLPIWVAIVVFCFTFWITTILILISFVKGWQYRFLGPELGKDGVNKAADAVGNAVYNAGCDIKNSIDNRNNHGSNQDSGSSGNK